MNDQQRAVVQQALEALGNITNFERLEKARAALRQLLEQPEPVQEPVAGIRWEMGSDGKLKQIDLPLTTPPAQPAAWVGLTDEDGQQIYDEAEGSVSCAIELTTTKLRKKNGY